MNKDTAISLFAVVGCAAIVIGFFWLRENTSKPVIKSHPVKVVSDMAKSPQSMELSQSSEASKLSSGIKNEQSDIHKSIDLSEEAVRERVLSAILGGITGQSAIDELSEEELLSVLFDRDAIVKMRRRAAWTLAKNGSEKILSELEKILNQEDMSGDMKAAIAEGLGYSSDLRAKEIILAALENEDDMVVRGAIRGLSATGNEDAISTLSNFMNSTDVSESVRAEAATGLGKIDSPDAFNALIGVYQSAEEANNDNLKKDIIAALGQRDISETGEFFQKLLDESTSDPSMRLAAIEAIEDAQGNTNFILLNTLNDEDSAVRAEAAWALALADDSGDIAGVLQDRLMMEVDAGVRKRLYQALGNQEKTNIDDATARLIYEEPDMAARLAGYDSLAKNIGSSENTKLEEQFEKTAIPELQEIALSDDKLNYKLSAVIALKRTGTVESLRALEEIAAKSLDPKVKEATGIER
jgi:HEAT repeat protein